MSMKVRAPLPPTVSEAQIGEEHLGQVVILLPKRTDTLQTKIGPAEATVCDFWVWDGTEGTEVGEVFVFWARVQSQLAPMVDSGEAVVGRLVKNGRAYEIEEIDPETAGKVAAWGEDQF